MPISFALDSLGDLWSLLIVRARTDFEKKTYGAFFATHEGMATNSRSSRFAQLRQTGMLAKKPYATELRKTVYGLTEKGLDLLLILLELANWSARHDP